MASTFHDCRLSFFLSFVWLAFHCACSLRLQSPVFDASSIEASVGNITASTETGTNFTHIAENVTNTIKQFEYLSNQSYGVRWLYHSPSANTTRVCTKSKLAVCIVGQLSRLETRSKISNLLVQEGSRRGIHNVDVFFAMETHANFYVNKGTVGSNSSSCNKDFRNATELQLEFAPFYRDGLYHTHIDWQAHLANFKSYGKDKPWVSAGLRLQSHLSQWNHWSQCSYLIKKYEKSVNCQYETVVKLRDNGIVTKPMTVGLREKVLFKGCPVAGTDAVYASDKFLIAPRRFMENALEGTFALAMRVNNGDRSAIELVEKVKSPEAFQLISYENLGVETEVDSERSISVVDGRCSEGELNSQPDGAHQSEAVVRQWCLVAKAKDCRPVDFNEEYPTCPAHHNRQTPTTSATSASNRGRISKRVHISKLGSSARMPHRKKRHIT
eukprot:gnl/TRDRNA2_/TRDRNA2_175104_c8_seq3.p1 gnl/TRDRNA2_/TRDRNA2_175104_c8~~gnl/TRDRNA2_/TRDRNA2_175104_c8_seq3.p1  ORF type:complete len:441 (-),score=24.09 gnl/TRDRNA2_/TRDRNA2_175104_c8_seq3:164-1486(-)